MSRILITGGSGFIGTNFIEKLLQEGHELCNVDVRAPALAHHRPAWRQVDILDQRALVGAVEQFQPEWVYHLAARTDMHGATVSDYRANTDGVGNVLAALPASTALKRVVFASSRLVCKIGYQPRSDTDYLPTTPYGESKVIGEKLVRGHHHGTYEWLMVRPTSIWGPWFHVPYRNFFDAIRRGHYIHPRGRQILKSFGFVGNSIHQLSRLMQAPVNMVHEKMFYLADYQPIEVRQWGELIRREFAAPSIHDVPMGVMQGLAKVGDGLSALGWKNVPLTSFRLDNLTTEMLHNTDNLRAVCGDLPYTAEQGVPITVAWMKQESS